MGSALDRIQAKLGVPNLLELLESVSASDLQSLLMAVYASKAGKLTPAQVLAHYETSSLVRPSPFSDGQFSCVESAARHVCPEFLFLELSPMCPLGTCSVLGPVSQNKIVSTSRTGEVVSDSTNVLALEAAVRRRGLVKERRTHECVRLACFHRLVRPVPFAGPASYAHFRVFGLVTAGRDQGDCRFEVRAMAEHIAAHVLLLQSLGVKSMRLTVTDLTAHGAAQQIETCLEAASCPLPIIRDEERPAAKSYYGGLCFSLDAADASDNWFNIADGGVTDWTQRLLSSHKERLVISGAGLERICMIAGI